MKIDAIRTCKIASSRQSINDIVDTFVKTFAEDSILVVTSKIVALCDGRVVPRDGTDKQALIESEADHYLPRGGNKYDVTLTIKNNILIASAGIDGSNAGDYYVLWPRDPQESANGIWRHLRNRFGVNRCGVILSDSATEPLRRGVVGRSVACCGFAAINDRIGHPDIYGRPLQMTMVNIADACAAAAVVVMGEADEQTPLAIITDLPFVEFLSREPSPEELRGQHIAVEDDLYGQLLMSVDWKTKKKASMP